MGTSKAGVQALLAVFARMAKPTGPVSLRPAYVRAVERWEELPENAEGADKSWVGRSERAWEEHFGKARAR